MVKVNDVEEPAAILAIPDDEDVQALQEMLTTAREGEKERSHFDFVGGLAGIPDELERKLTLEQELQAQLNNQVDDD